LKLINEKPKTWNNASHKNTEEGFFSSRLKSGNVLPERKPSQQSLGGIVSQGIKRHTIKMTADAQKQLCGPKLGSNKIFYNESFWGCLFPEVNHSKQ
jgi:hypothetical protein